MVNLARASAGLDPLPGTATEDDLLAEEDRIEVPPPGSSDPADAADLGLISPDLGPEGEDGDDEAEALAWCEEEGLIWDEEAGCWSLPEDMED